MDALDDSLIVNDDWDRLPFAKNWKVVLNQAKIILQQNLKTNDADKIYQELKDFIEVLVKQGDVYEDVVLKTAIVYYISKNADLNVNMFDDISDDVILGVSILLGNNKNSVKGDLDQIFLNTTYRYLGKIKIAEYLTRFKNAKTADLSKTFKLVAEVDSVLANYAKISHKNLITILKNTRKDF